MQIEKIKVKRKGKKLIVELQPPFLDGDIFYDKYRMNKDVLRCYSIDIFLKMYDEKLTFHASYGYNCYSKSHSQICNMEGVTNNKKDAARLWFDDEENFFYRYNQMTKIFKDDEKFLKEIEENRVRLLNKRIEEKNKKALDKINRNMKILNKNGYFENK
jgi:hypothetical protein